MHMEKREPAKVVGICARTCVQVMCGEVARVAKGRKTGEETMREDEEDT